MTKKEIDLVVRLMVGGNSIVHNPDVEAHGENVTFRVSVKRHGKIQYRTIYVSPYYVNASDETPSRIADRVREAI